MLRNYLITAFRNLIKNRVFSFINVMGLALGLASSLLIYLWIRDEKSVNHFHADSDRLYTLYERQYIDNKIDAGYYTPGLLANELKKVIPEVELASNASMDEHFTFQHGDKIIKEQGAYADSDFFKMFSYPLLEGSVKEALNTPVGIAISKKMAADLFGSPAAAMGGTLRWENAKDFKVTAVFADLPENVSDKFDFVINWPAFLEANDWVKNWGNNGPRTFIKLRAEAKPDLVARKLLKFLDNYNKEQTATFRVELYMQRFSEVYLHSNFKEGRLEGGRGQYVNLFSLIAIFILLIACINFMNLTTARSAKRAKEIGVRKVAGAIRPALIRQFLSEAMLITFIAVVIALLMVGIFLPYFNQLTGKHIAMPLRDAEFWMGLVILMIVTGFIAGSYPALFLSSFRPILVLKGSLTFSHGANFFRKGLVVFQFVLSIILITGTIIISKQLRFIQRINLGYDRENLIYVPIEGELGRKYNVLKEEALRSQAIQSVSRIIEAPTNIGSNTLGVDWDGKNPQSSPAFVQTGAGFGFVKAMHLSLVAGRDHSAEFPSDSAGYLINESALKVINYKDPIGKRLTFWGKKGTIVGVLKDFHFTSLHDPIQPIVIRLSETENFGTILIRTESGKTREALAAIEKICKQLNPKFPFSYLFADEEYSKLYKSEEVVGRLASAFAFLAIFISCMGLLGLAIFTAEQRRREFGIRKVLGASAVSLFTLLSAEFMLLVTIAMAIATPLAWLLMQAFLADFAYRTPVGIWIFGVAGLLAVLIALLTVSYQALKAAVANPVGSLRSE